MAFRLQLGCLDFRFWGGVVTGAPWLDPPSPKKGSHDTTPLTNPGTSWGSMEAEGGREQNGGVGGRGLEGEGGTYLG